jgi:predicted metallo-beta-lactamase superfamily hydrolase
MQIKWKPIWSESLGAKSFCTFVKTPDISILIDPGTSIIQPSFPGTDDEKLKWLEDSEKAIKSKIGEAEILIITHYHYDHFYSNELDIYKDKLVFIKDPNEYINDSQRKRAEEFFNDICEHYGPNGSGLKTVLEKNTTLRKYPNPMDNLELSRTRDFGDYNLRRQELLGKWLKWFNGRVKNWNKNKLIPELKFDELEIKFMDGKYFEFDKTKIRFPNAMFHGIEFSKVGWVVPVIVESEQEKLLYTSDLNGPMIEDYAEWIINENPNVLLLDGPSSYMIPYTVNLINFKRTVENIIRIIEESEIDTIIFDHHLLRDTKYKERMEPAYKTAEKVGKKLLTVAEYYGKEPVVLELI